MDVLEELDKTRNYLEKRIDKLTKLVEELLLQKKNSTSMENEKLDYRLIILNKYINMHKNTLINMWSNSETFYTALNMDIKQYLTEIFQIAICDAFGNDIDIKFVDISVATKFADYQCSSAMRLNKILKSKGIKMSPKEIAEKIISKIPDNECIETLDTSGIGFININIKKQYVIHYLEFVLQNRTILLPKISNQKQRTIVDFSSPNIAKEMHVGHLRSTIIGDSISRLLEYLGHDVLRLNHIGDWGTQFGMLIAHLIEKKEANDFVLNIESLQKLYKESKERFDKDPEFKKKAYNYVVKLQSSDSEIYCLWQEICRVSRQEFEKIYDRLGVTIIERGESFYQTFMENMVENLKQGKHLIEDEGRMILWSGKDKIPLTIIKSDGGFTYDTSDLAALKHRCEIEKANRIIYVTDAGQATHFELIFNCAEKLNFVDREKVRLDHVGFGAVLGEDKKKFKTRSGESVKLIDLLDEGLKRALDTLKAKNRPLSEDELKSAQEAVAYGCIKYADLCNSRNNEYVFSFNKMLQDKGNTAVYLLYAYARIKSIARNAGITNEKLTKIVEEEVIELSHEKEWKLAKNLIRFSDVIQKASQDLQLHKLCEYLYDVATSFSEFYDNCYCIEKNNLGIVIRINYSRILLCEVTAIFMEKCFDILGMKYIDKM